MRKSEKPRALVVVGAGASVEYGIPGTIAFGELIDIAVQKDDYCLRAGGTDVYFDVKAKLTDYYGSGNEAHFERLYHVLHELDALKLFPSAIPKFRPVMHPFLQTHKSYPEQALRAAAKTILKAIYTTASGACDAPKTTLSPLTTFLDLLESHFLPRVYTTNYDDFFEQAGADCYFNGFTRPVGAYRLFDPAAFWGGWGEAGCFHLHGSVHMGFPHPKSHDVDIGDIAWFPSRAEALRFSEYTGSGVDRMDGTGIARGAIITGLDKLGRIQQLPFAGYYAGFAREVMEATVIFVLGSGLADLHLNSWLKTARRAKPDIPILYVGFWPGDASDLYSTFQFESGTLELSLFHDLRVDLVRIPGTSFKAFDGWTMDAHGTAALWADGFQSFLKKPEVLEAVLARLGAIGK